MKVLLWPLLKRWNWQLIVSVKRNIPVQPSETWLKLLSIKAHRCHFDVTSYNIYCMKTLRQCLSSSINPMVYLQSYRYWHVWWQIKEHFKTKGKIGERPINYVKSVNFSSIWRNLNATSVFITYLFGMPQTQQPTDLCRIEQTVNNLI